MIPFALKYVMVLIATIFMAVVLTPLVRFLALRIGAVDNPNARRINKVPMPSAGGQQYLFLLQYPVWCSCPLLLHAFTFLAPILNMYFIS